MARGTTPTIPVEVQRVFWSGIRAGLTIEAAAGAAGVSLRTGRRWFAQRGGVMPPKTPRVRSRSLCFDERERIAELRGAGLGVRAIARELGRHPSTISRELWRDKNRRPSDRHKISYRASTAQADADAKAKRPKPAKLATCLRLRREVQNRLKKNHSPVQIARRLRLDFPDDPEMWVAHETIYQSLYVQSRGGLKRELCQHLRTGRTVRKPRRKPDQRRGRLPDMINISERPAEVADRSVPGHWEGDLIIGSGNSAVGSLVERTTRFTLLLHLPGGHTADIVAQAMITKIKTLPEQLRRSLTWDQGKEMARHAKITTATGLQIYFCDPHSPWQRGTNENTNRLLRQYFPKGTSLAHLTQADLDTIAKRLNTRPRKTLDYATPADKIATLLR